MPLTAMADQPWAVFVSDEASEAAPAEQSEDALPNPDMEMDMEAAPEAPADCDAAKLKKKVAGAYKPVFYDNDFSYLCDPCYCDWHLGEALKRNCLHDGVV
ncbi:MAG: hypothetical protein KDA55_07005, partial [Planctomycetales bacterium]|nr:hypothetical protein [Planctomycetales bacterium]